MHTGKGANRKETDMFPSLARNYSYPTMQYMARIVKIEYGYEAIFSGFAQETRYPVEWGV